MRIADTMICHRLLPVLLIAAGLSQSAFAQINPFRGSRSTPLNNDDMAALTDATNRLLGNPQLATGASETWSNPQSGASGTVIAGHAVQRKGLVPGPTPQRTTNLTWCKTANGWKIAS
jgi:hypothetical protein